MLLFVTALKLVVEIALMVLLGRFVLGLLAGARRQQNGIWQLFDVLVRPFERVVRAISPRAVLDRHIPLATGLLLLSAWLVLTLMKIQVCLDVGIDQCR
jgi:hypothetical protein